MINSKAIRKIMIDQGEITVSEIASRIGKSPATVGRWLDAGIMPTIYAEALAEVLEIPLDKRLPIFFDGMLPDKLQIKNGDRQKEEEKNHGSKH